MKQLATLICLLLCLTACSPEELLNPPRAATQTAQAERPSVVESAPPTPTPSPTEPLVSSTPELKPILPTIVAPKTLKVWLNETSAEHRVFAAETAQRFFEQYDIQIEFIFVDTDRVTGLARSADATLQLPDVIMHTLEQTAALVDAEILDAEAATDAINQLGVDSFEPNVLNLMPRDGDLYAAIPSDSWGYVLLYRADWFSAAGLAPPTSYDSIVAAAAQFYNLRVEVAEGEEPPFPVSGIVVPTEQDLPATQRVFEWFATANNCQVVSTTGQVQIQDPNCLATLDYYRQLVNLYSPPDYQTNLTALRSYMAGRTAMVLLPTAALSNIAGGDPARLPSCAECVDNPAYLAANTGIVAELHGYNVGLPATSFAQANYFGIVKEADPMAVEFIQFWFNDAYEGWLAIEPERKVPAWLHGEALQQWQNRPLTGTSMTLAEAYSAEPAAAERVISAATQHERWGFANGNGRAVSALYETLNLAPVLQQMLSGYISTSQAILDLDAAVYEVYSPPRE